MIRQRRRWRGVLRDALLLPVALLLVLLEDVVWRGAHALVRQLAGLAAVAVLRRRLARLPGWAALPLFLVPEVAGRGGELWAAWLLYRGHPKSSVLVFVVVRLVATLIVVFIWQSCEPALMRLAWFALASVWVRTVRNWALARTAGLRRRLHRLADGGISRRLGAWRRLIGRIRV